MLNSKLATLIYKSMQDNLLKFLYSIALSGHYSKL